MVLVLKPMSFFSPDFVSKTRMTRCHSKEGGNLSPALCWQDLPEGTRRVALFCHDPATTLVDSLGPHGRVHWLMYNIPAEQRMIARGCTDFSFGMNSYDRLAWDGPESPTVVYFWLLALDNDEPLPPGLRLPELLGRVQSRALGMTRLMGLFTSEEDTHPIGSRELRERTSFRLPKHHMPAARKGRQPVLQPAPVTVGDIAFL